MRTYDFIDRFLSVAGMLLAVLIVVTIAAVSIAVFAEHQEYRVYKLTCDRAVGECMR